MRDLPAAIAVVLALVVPAPRADADLYVVTRTDDPAPGPCHPGDCSLREAVRAANLHPGFDQIELSAETYRLTLPTPFLDDEDAAATGDLDIADDVLIGGPGFATTFVDAGGLGPGADHRIFDVRAGRLIVTQLTVRNGQSAEGGGIRVRHRALLWAVRMEMRDNRTSGYGGGLWNRGTADIHECGLVRNFAHLGGGGLANEGEARVANTSVNQNSTLRWGGGLLNLSRVQKVASSAAVLEVRQGFITGNRARAFDGSPVIAAGGGVAHVTLDGVGPGTLRMFGPHISQNEAGLGGGLFTTPLTDTQLTGRVRESPSRSWTVVLNTARHGGGIYNGGTLSLIRGEASANHALDGRGGGVLNAETGMLHASEITLYGNDADLGGGLANEGWADVNASAIVAGTIAFRHDHAGSITFPNPNLARVEGGGVWNSGRLTLGNVTVAGNEAARGGGLFNSGHAGAVANELRLFNCTVASNVAADGAAFFGEAVVVNPTHVNTIVAYNGPVPSGSGPLCGGVVWTSLGHNLDTDGSCDLGAAGDLPFTSPQLGPLSPLWGSTPAMRPEDGSPVIDAGDGCTAFDQVGTTRPLDGDGDGIPLCDIGSIERLPPPAP